LPPGHLRARHETLRAGWQFCQLFLLIQEISVCVYHRFAKTALFKLVAVYHNQRGEPITVMAVK
jgi:hypothetical protein